MKNKETNMNISQALNLLQESKYSDEINIHFSNLIMDLAEELSLDKDTSIQEILTRQYKNILGNYFADYVEVNGCPRMSYYLATIDTLCDYVGQVSIKDESGKNVILQDVLGVEPMTKEFGKHYNNPYIVDELPSDVYNYIDKVVANDNSREI